MVPRIMLPVAALILAAVATYPTAYADAGSPGAAPPRAALVRIPFPQEDGTLTPYTFDLGYSLMTLVYDTLTSRDAGGVPRPWLARSVDTSPDGLTVTIRLAAGAAWQDGPPVTSADVAFTFQYVAQHPQPRFTAELDAVAGVDAPDAATAVVRLRHPSPGFVDLPLADLPILPRHLWAALPAGVIAPPGLPVGSGPYRLVEHRQGQMYRFQANTAYFRGPPAVSTIAVPIINDATATAAALGRREVDMVPVTLSPALTTGVQGLGVRVAAGSSYLGTVLVLNVRRPPFQQPAVRQAVAQALDLPRIAGVVGDAVPADRGYLHPDSGWAPPQPVHTHDAAAARRTLAAVSRPGLELLVADNDPVKLEAGRQVVLGLGQAGVTVALRSVPVTALEHALGADGSPPTFQMAISTSPQLASYDPDLLGRLFGSRGSFNYSGYTSATFDGVVDRVASTPDASGRRAAVVEALQLLAVDAPIVPLFFSNGAFAYRPSIYDGWVYIKGSGILDTRSFLPPPAAVTVPSPVTLPPVEASPLSPLTLAALGLLGLAGVIAATQGLRSRRGRA